MFYHDYQTIAQLKKQEVERNAKHAWKFFEQPATRRFALPACEQKQHPNCCQVPAHA